MFGNIRPAVKNLLIQVNRWTQAQTFEGNNAFTGTNTFTRNALVTTTQNAITIQNTTSATLGVQTQVSPALKLSAQGWDTNESISRAANFHIYTSSDAYLNPISVLKFDSSTDSGSLTNLLSLYSVDTLHATASVARMDLLARLRLTVENSTAYNAYSSFSITNPTGTQTSIHARFGANLRWGINVNSDSQVYYKCSGSSPLHYFQTGSSAGSENTVLQISGLGLYNYGYSLNTTTVTAGNADTNALSTLNSYGSFSVKGKVISSITYTIDNTSTMWYVNPINASCTGTATACSTYTGAGEATCNSHSAVGCSWVAAVTESCSAANGTDSSTCTGQGAGCTWESTSCSGANNTDESTCTNQNSAYGGSCSYDTTTCPAQTSTAACNAIPGCTAVVSGDCTTLSDGGADGTNCATQPECSYDSGSGVCSGTFFSSCSGSICTGTYNTGNCTGSYVITPAYCGGTALCSNISTETPCNAESPCVWESGSTITLPTRTNANTGGTAQYHSFVHVGSTGIATIQANTGSTIMQYPTIKLYKKGDRVTLHHLYETASCSTFSTQTPCNAQSGCSWVAAITCSNYVTEETCTAQSGSGCSWDGLACSGAGSAAYCSGTYELFNQWVPHNYERAKNYVAKTAAYTVTNEDDVINYTSGTVNLTLPASNTIVPARPLYLKNRGAGTITLNTTGGELIDGNASGVLTLTTGQEKTVFPLSAGWIIIGV